MKLSTIQAQSLANKIYKELMEEKKRKNTKFFTRNY